MKYTKFIVLEKLIITKNYVPKLLSTYNQRTTLCNDKVLKKPQQLTVLVYPEASVPPLLKSDNIAWFSPAHPFVLSEWSNIN